MLSRRRALGLVGAGVASVGLAGGVALALRKRGPETAGPRGGARGTARSFARIDTHMHIDPGGIDRLLALMDRWGIAGSVNLSGMSPGPPRMALETQLEAARKTAGRVAVFTTPNFIKALRTRPSDYGVAMASELEQAKTLGAAGLKITKGLGLGYPNAAGTNFLAVDDAGLDPLFEKAGELGMPVAIHSGDPQAFWQPANEKNERWDELQAHPEWSFHGEAQPGLPWPAWEAIYAAFDRRVARHPKTKFIGVHFGNAPEEPDRVAAMLKKYPNLYIDTAARVPAIGRPDAAHAVPKMQAFYEIWQDRVVFGTDTGVGESQEQMMFGSTGATPPTDADEARFFESTYRYFETGARQIESPTPVQGRWKVDGVNLPNAILQKIYYDNAAKLLGWRPQLPAPKSSG